jgi:hypothetical protein
LNISVARSTSLQEGQIGTGGLHLVTRVIRLRALLGRLRHGERGLRLAQARQQVVLVQLANHLSLVNRISHIDRKLENDAAGLGFNFHLGGGLDLAGGHHRLRQI